MTRADSYAQGFSEGARWGEHDDTFARAMFSETIADARERAATMSENLRAYWLGVLRGYRAVTR